ncbi:MAG: MATE family efflux transporter [Tannerella sp.]|nr:MATE family efflux transporter [Tannerella sp.]
MKPYSCKHIRNVSLPVIIGLLAQNIINVTDTAFLGRVGEVELGASAMGGLYYICWFTVFFGFSTGVQIIIGRRNGEKNYSAIGPTLMQGLIFLLLLAAIIFWLSFYYAGNIMRIMISSDVILDSAMSFIKWRIAGFFFASVTVMYRAFYVGITQTRMLTVNAIVMAASNIFLDYALIFGHFGMPQLGVEGAAVASVIAEMISALFFVVYTFTAVDRRKYGMAFFRRFDFRLVRRILSISSYTMLQYFVSMGTFLLFFATVERQGQHSLAIANIVRSIYIVMFIPLNALSATSNTLVTNIIGEGRISDVMPLVRRISRMSFFIMFVCVSLICIFPEEVLMVYTDDISLINESVLSIYVISVALIISSIASVFFNSVSGTGNTKPALLLELGVLVIYTVSILVLGLYFRQPVHICFTVEIIYFAGLFIGSILYLRYANWQHKRV